MVNVDKLAPALRSITDGDYVLLQDIELVKGNVKGKVDNVVVGPSGVYALNVHGWRGRVKFSRRGLIICGGFTRERAKRRALDQASIVRRQLAAWGVVRPVMTVLVVTDATLDHGPIDLKSFAIVPLDKLAGWIAGRQYRLAPIEIEQIVHGLAPPSSEGAFWAKWKARG